MLTIHPSTGFIRSFKRLPSHIKEDFAKKINIFKKHPFHPSLHTHKLNGNLSDCHSFYIKDGFRVLFEFVESENVLLIKIGSHDDYKKWSRK